MLEFSKIDKDFSIYKKNKVYLFGASSAGRKIKRFLEQRDIAIEAFIDNNKEKAGTIFEEIRVISYEQFLEIISEDKKDYIIQISSSYDEEISKQLKKDDLKYISFAEYCNRVSDLGKYLLVKHNPYYKKQIYEQMQNRTRSRDAMWVYEYLGNLEIKNKKNISLLVSSPKVGCTTIRKSCEGEIMCVNHSYIFIPEDVKRILKKRNVNLIMGVRDVLSQNISMLFQGLLGSYWDMEEYWYGGGNIQLIYEKHFLSSYNENEIDCYFEYRKSVEKHFLIQDFFDQQLKAFWGIDIYEYPFNKERGYTVYQFDNLNVMIYQLEKMNSLEKEIGNFLEIGDFKLCKSNIGENKWYNEAYKKAKKELKIPAEHFEECYNGKYMKHFYNENDIEKFKRKWIGNVV